MCETTNNKIHTIITILIWMERKKNETCGVHLPLVFFLFDQLEHTKILNFMGFFSALDSFECVFACAYIILEVPMVKKIPIKSSLPCTFFHNGFPGVNFYFLSGIKRGQLHKQIVCMRVYVSCTNWTCLHVSKKKRHVLRSCHHFHG